MEISEVTVRLLLVFFPGIICAMVVDALTVHRERKLWSFVLNSFVLGLTCYLLTFALWRLFAPGQVTIMQSLLQVKAEEGKESIAVVEIVVATMLSLPLAFGLSYASNHKVLHLFGQKLRVTRKFGHLDVWDWAFNNAEIPEWVVVKDLDAGLAYEGWVRAFSDTADSNELFLRDVRVVDDNTGEEVDTLWGLYLARPRDKLTIEFSGLTVSPTRQEHHEPENKREENHGQGPDSEGRTESETLDA